MVALLEETVRGDLSVREVEQRVRDRASPTRRATHEGEAATPATVLPWVRQLEDRLRTKLGTKVKVENGAGFRGRIVIEYFSRADLDRLCEQLAPPARLE
jgi:ParB family chromosome partitioning protein